MKIAVIPAQTWFTSSKVSDLVSYVADFGWTITCLVYLGDAIYYYADQNASNGLLRVAVDDEQGQLVNPTSPTIEYQQLLWSKTGLGPGDHSFVVNHAGSEGQYMELDYIV